MRKYRIALLAFATVLAASPALAKGPRTNTGSGSTTCQVSPTPVSNGSQYTVSGSGYAPSTNLTIFVGGSILMTTTSTSGNFSAGTWLAGASSGTYSVVVYAQSDTRHRNELATCSLQVN